MDIVVHQYNTPRFVIQCDSPTKRIHLSYHGEFHYNSVRGLTDSMDGVPATITLCEAPSLPQSAGSSQATSTTQSRSNASELVTQSVPWASLYSVGVALDMSSGDALDAIDLLLAHGNNFIEPSQEGSIMSVVAETDQLSLQNERSSNSTSNSSKPEKRDKGSKSSLRKSGQAAGHAEATQHRPAGETGEPTKALSKREKRLLKQGRKHAQLQSAPQRDSLPLQAGEVLI